MSDTQNGIHIAVIIGTSRPGNYTSKVTALVIDELENTPNCTVDVLDAGKLKLYFPGESDGADDAEDLQARVARATGVIIATPEYHGSPASKVKQILENLGFPSVLSGKPIALLGVAAGGIGAIKSLEMLRGILSHVGAIVLPKVVSVANVQDVFGEDGTLQDQSLNKRIRSVGTNLLDYIKNSICPRETLEAIVREK